MTTVIYSYLKALLNPLTENDHHIMITVVTTHKHINITGNGHQPATKSIYPFHAIFIDLRVQICSYTQKYVA